MENSRRYSFDEAQDEALKLQNKVLSGEALGYSDAEQRLEEGLLNSEQVEKAMEIYGDSVKEIVRITYQKIRQDGQRASLFGELEGIKYRTIKTYRQGKQQPVTIIEFVLPDTGKFNLVCKYDGSDMYKAQQENIVLQKYLPKIYFESSGIAAIEKIDGLELDRFKEALGGKDFFDQLVNESATIVHDINHSNFYLPDADFVEGHNVMYDLDKKHFRVFDIHAVHASNEKPEAKLFRFLNTIGERISDPLQVKFLMEFIKKYLEMYPEEPMSCDDVVAEEPAPGEPEYEEAFNRLKEARGFRVHYGTKISIQKEGRVVIDPEILSAIQEGDEKKLMQLFSKKSSKNRVTALDKSV